MSELIDTTEMYLRTIYELFEEGVPPLRARIAERLKQSGPTVSQTVARMERDGLVAVHPDRHLVLSEAGRASAARVMRRHRLAERLLIDVIGLEWHQVHQEACRWEHVISTDVERRLVDVLGAPTTSPYGNPIPSLDELGVTDVSEEFLDGARMLSAQLADGEVHEVVVTRLSEAIQAEPDLLQKLASVAMPPGRPVRAAIRGSELLIGDAAVPVAASDQIFVVAG
jgi:DtxR family transcriptional regulator, Mn-dependent transcriptional regulator